MCTIRWRFSLYTDVNLHRGTICSNAEERQQFRQTVHFEPMVLQSKTADNFGTRTRPDIDRMTGRPAAATAAAPPRSISQRGGGRTSAIDIAEVHEATASAIDIAEAANDDDVTMYELHSVTCEYSSR